MLVYIGVMNHAGKHIICPQTNAFVSKYGQSMFESCFNVILDILKCLYPF